MKRIGQFLLAVALVAGLARCGGGDSSYDFNGTWLFTETITTHVGTWFPWVGELTIAQNGNDIFLSFPGQEPVRGLCDPDSGTFNVQFTLQDGRVLCSYSGHAEDGDTMTGVSRCNADWGDWADSVWIAELIHR